MCSTRPLFSVLIPTFNRAKSVCNLIDEINQYRHDDIEIVVVDDCSDKVNWSTLKEFSSLHSNVRLIRNEENVGLTKNWNNTIKYAKGEWIGFICDDDEYVEDVFLRVRDLVDDIKEPCLILQSFEIEEATEWMEKGAETAKNTTLPPASGQFWSREITDKIGGFDERIKYCPDAEFWVRVAYYYPVLKVREFFVRPHQHDTNYMWSIFREPDLLENVALSIKISCRYTLGEDYDNSSLEYAVDDGLWETLRTIINNTFLQKNKMDIFNEYILVFIKHSFKMKRKSRMVKALIRLIIYRAYQPIRPSIKRMKSFVLNLRVSRLG